jgi:hypothetical protein
VSAPAPPPPPPGFEEEITRTSVSDTPQVPSEPAEPVKKASAQARKKPIPQSSSWNDALSSVGVAKPLKKCVATAYFDVCMPKWLQIVLVSDCWCTERVYQWFATQNRARPRRSWQRKTVLEYRKHVCTRLQLIIRAIAVLRNPLHPRHVCKRSGYYRRRPHSRRGPVHKSAQTVLYVKRYECAYAVKARTLLGRAQ